MKIELQPIPNRRGHRTIMVDGLQWGETMMHSHGPNGASYSFRQAGRTDLIYRQDADGHGSSPVRVRTQSKKWSRAPVEPIETRVLEEARKLIEEGLLRHPDIVAAERARRIDERQAAAHQREADLDAEFVSRAQKAVSTEIMDELTHSLRVELVDAIVEAMKWAKTK